MADAEEYIVCQCFFTHNIFLKEYEAHVVFESEQQFQSDYCRVCTNFAKSKVMVNTTSESSTGSSINREDQMISLQTCTLFF